MKSERFLRIVVPRRGYSELASPDAPIQTRDRRTALRTPHAGDARTFEEGLGVTVWDTLPASDSWWAVCTYLQKGMDEHHRPFISNHSCFLPSDKYSGYAAFFDSSILEPLRRDTSITESEDRGIIGPLQLLQPNSSGHGIRTDELELLSRFTEYHDPRLRSDKSCLPELLACILAGVGFRMRVKEPSDATRLAVVLLKIAALSGQEKPPRIATFMPKSGIYSQYTCQILPEPRLRANSEFASNGTPDDTANWMAERLAQAIDALSLGDLETALATGKRYRTVVDKEKTSQPIAESVAEPPTDVKSRYDFSTDLKASADEEFRKRYETLLEYEAWLNGRTDKLERKDRDLQAREQRLQSDSSQLQNSLRELNQRQQQIRDQSTQLSKDKSQNSFWGAYSKIDELLQGKKVPTLKESSLEVLYKLLDKPSRDEKTKLIELLDNELLETNIRTIQDVGGNTKLEYGKVLVKLKKEKEKQDRKKG